MTKTTKETKPCVDCVCEDDDLKKKQIEWYDTMITSHKEMAKRDKKIGVFTTVATVLMAAAMLTITIVNIIKCFGE